MPYVDDESKARVADRVAVRDIQELNEGELNYLLTTLVLAWAGSPMSYATIVDVVGTLDCMKAEFYRRIAAPYEDMKRDLNGDVYL